jgi:hypothetical protein
VCADFPVEPGPGAPGPSAEHAGGLPDGAGAAEAGGFSEFSEPEVRGRKGRRGIRCLSDRFETEVVEIIIYPYKSLHFAFFILMS